MCTAGELEQFMKDACTASCPIRHLPQFKSLFFFTEIRRTDSEISSSVDATPGKLDHASIVAYEVGFFSSTDNRKFAPSSP